MTAGMSAPWGVEMIPDNKPPSLPFNFYYYTTSFIIISTYFYSELLSTCFYAPHKRLNIILKTLTDDNNLLIFIDMTLYKFCLTNDMIPQEFQQLYNWLRYNECGLYNR